MIRHTLRNLTWALALVLVSLSTQEVSAQLGMLPTGVWPGFDDGPTDRYRVREFNIVYYRSTNPGATTQKADRIDRFIDRYWSRPSGASIQGELAAVYPTSSGPEERNIVITTTSPINSGWNLILADETVPQLGPNGVIDHAYYMDFKAQLNLPYFGWEDYDNLPGLTLPLKYAYLMSQTTSAHSVAIGTPWYTQQTNRTSTEAIASEPNYFAVIEQDGNTGGNYPAPTLAPLCIRKVTPTGNHWVDSNGTMFLYCHPTFARWVDPDGVHPVPPETLDLYFWDHSSDSYVLAATQPWPTDPATEWNHSRVDLNTSYSFGFLDSNQLLQVVPAFLYPELILPQYNPEQYNAVEIKYAVGSDLARGPNDPNWDLPTLDRTTAGPQGYYEGAAGMWFTTRPLYSHDLGTNSGPTGGSAGGPPSGSGGGSGGAGVGGGSSGGGGGSPPGGPGN